VKVLHGLEAVDPPFAQSVLTIGNFDGVHRAHQQLIAQAGLFAANTKGPVVVLTFEPHPLSIVAGRPAPARLSLPEERLRCLAKAGADVVVIARSEPSLLGLDAEAFVDQVIRERFNPTHIVEGPSFGFGRGRKGTPELLRDLAAGFGCEVHIVSPVTVEIDAGDSLLVSSSLIRSLIADGRVRRAGLCLGRRYALIGEVVEGAGRGRVIGFPTVNVAVSDQLVPGDSVYVGRATVCGKTYASAISIGSAPTFGEGKHMIEAHLLDFEGDLYGEPIRVEFQRRLRRQQKFESADALVEQLKRDVQTVHDEAVNGTPRPSYGEKTG
jgi:riboflavin kinase/FMN adenylyltransferase